MIKIDITGDEAVRANLARLGDKLAGKALANTADDVENYIDKAADRHTKTGALRRSIFSKKVGDGYEIGHNLQHALYAKWLVKGSRPHVIRPKNKKTLRWAIGGRFIFAKEVHHPGYAGDDYIKRAADLAPRMFAIHVDQLLRSQS